MFIDPKTIKAPVEEYLEAGILVERGPYFHTILPCYMKSLNEKGKALLKESQERHANGDYKAHFKHWTLHDAASGSGVCDNGLKFLNSTNNLTLLAWKGPDNYLKSSCIIMLDPDHKWCVTMSGSLYSLDPEGMYRSEYEYTLAAEKGDLEPEPEPEPKSKSESKPEQEPEPEPKAKAELGLGLLWGPDGPEPCMVTSGGTTRIKSLNVYMYRQHGGGVCSLCGSPGTNKTTCPLNPAAKNPNPAKHPRAAALTGAPAPIPAAAAVPAPIAASSVAADCTNPSTLMGDEVADIDPRRLYRAWTGNCYDIVEDLYPYLLSGKTTDPYTNQPLWRNDAERDEILRHRGLSPAQRKQLHAKLLGGNPLTEDMQELLKRNKQVFHLIGTVGLILYGDYHPDFKPSQEALAHLDDAISKSPDADKLGDIRATQLNSITLGEIMSEQGSSCIHGIGMRLARLYLSLYMVMGGEPVMGPLAKGYNRVSNPNTITYSVYALYDATYYVGIYLYDEETYGRNSKLGHLGTIVFDDTTLTWSDFDIAENQAHTSSHIAYPTARAVSMYDAAQSEMQELMLGSGVFDPWDMIPTTRSALAKLITEHKLQKRNIEPKYYEISGRALQD